MEIYPYHDPQQWDRSTLPLTSLVIWLLLSQAPSAPLGRRGAAATREKLARVSIHYCDESNDPLRIKLRTSQRNRVLVLISTSAAPERRSLFGLCTNPWMSDDCDKSQEINECELKKIKKKVKI